MRLLIGTENAGKFIEIGEALADLKPELLKPSDLHITGSPDESGDTYALNASIKAHYYHSLSGLPTIADDSGIVVDALRGELGVQTRRWGAGAEASDEEWIKYFLDRMRRENNKSAQFICNISYIDPHGKESLFEGVCEGIITEDLEGQYLPGLPISACFKPKGCSAVYSAMSIEQKNAISHRGRAVSMLRQYLIGNS